VAKLFGSYIISKAIPLTLRVDLRQYVGGANGLAGDVESVYAAPRKFGAIVMFAGPSFTFADRLHMQTLFGVSTDQSLASGYPDYLTHKRRGVRGIRLRRHPVSGPPLAVASRPRRQSAARLRRPEPHYAADQPEYRRAGRRL